MFNTGKIMELEARVSHLENGRIRNLIDLNKAFEKTEAALKDLEAKLSSSYVE